MFKTQWCFNLCPWGWDALSRCLALQIQQAFQSDRHGTCNAILLKGSRAGVRAWRPRRVCDNQGTVCLARQTNRRDAIHIFDSEEMSDDNQIFVPPSFVERYLAPGQIKPRAPLAEIAQRYELCEDLAQLLTETASNLFHTMHITESDVLGRCLSGLAGEGSVVTPDEAQWVVRRLAELMNWGPLVVDPPADGAAAGA